MPKLLSGLGHLHGAGKWIMVAVTSLAAIIGLLVNARSLGLTPWLGLGGVSFANLAARRVVLAPAQDTLTAIGDTFQLAATITDEHGAVVSGATLVWATDDSSVATVDSSGAVVARGPGVAMVTATVREHVGRARVAVIQRVNAVAIGPDTAVRLPEGGGVHLLARALDARRRVVAGRTIQWVSADSAIAAVGPSGIVSARAPGRTTITASADGFSATIPAEVSLAPATLRLLSGGDQRASAGRLLPQPVAIQVLSRGGRPVPGTAVVFAMQEGLGKVDPDTATADRDGRVRVAWTLGSQAGPQHLAATAGGVDTTIVVAAEADPVAANTRVQQAGDVPQGPIGAALTAPVEVRVTDSSGAAVADVPVAWTTSDGSIEALAPRTDSLGAARARWTLGRRAGPQRARVQVGNPRTMPPFTVTATALAGAAAGVSVESGADQVGTVGSVLTRPVVVRLTDSAGNAAAGATLRAAAGGGSVAETMLVSDQNGRVALHWMLGRQAGPQWLEVRSGSGAPVRVGARARPMEPANVTPSGAPRSAPAGRALSRPVVFTVTDAYGNPIPDVQVAFVAAAGSVAPARVMTDAHGIAATRWTLGSQPGDQTLRAAVRGTAVRDSAVVRAVRRPSGR